MEGRSCRAVLYLDSLVGPCTLPSVAFWRLTLLPEQKENLVPDVSEFEREEGEDTFEKSKDPVNSGCTQREVPFPECHAVCTTQVFPDTASGPLS